MARTMNLKMISWGGLREKLGTPHTSPGYPRYISKWWPWWFSRWAFSTLSGYVGITRDHRVSVTVPTDGVAAAAPAPSEAAKTAEGDCMQVFFGLDGPGVAWTRPTSTRSARFLAARKVKKVQL